MLTGYRLSFLASVKSYELMSLSSNVYMYFFLSSYDTII